MNRPTPSHPVRHALLAVFAVLGAIAALVLPAQSASAANYQYWGYYQVANGAWTFAQVGPDKSTPADGAIEGWRWAVDDGTGTAPRTPRALPSFTAVCDTTPAQTGKKRVAVVIDFGRPADGDATTTPPKPRAQCASVPTAATGAEVLAAVAEVRSGTGGLVCALDAYPASGCGGEIATLSEAQKAADTPVSIAPVTAAAPTTTASATAAPATAAPVATSPAASSSPVGLWVGLVVLVLGGGALAWSLRRRRSAG